MSHRPNILWIVTTQWRAQTRGGLDEPGVRTPFLDALAAAGIDYGQAVTPHPFGPFARAAMLTGVPSPANGVAQYYDPLPSESRTVAHALADRGYRTAFFGKWHLGRRDPATPLVGEAAARALVPAEGRGGFGFWEGFDGGFLLNDPWLQGTRLPEPRRFPGYQPEVLASRLEAWVAEQEQDREPTAPPWFCVLSVEPPHPPYGAPAPGSATRDPAALALAPNVPLGGPAEARVRRELAGYLAHVEATDRCLGSLALRLSSHDSNAAGPEHRRRTAVAFTSVHGDMHGAHGLFRKGWPHEESVRVPLVVVHPGEAPRRDPSAVSLLDLPAMALAWSEGRAWAGRPEAARLSMPSVVGLPDQCDRVWTGIRTPTRKLILNADGSPWLFFDLEADPFELNDLSTDPGWAAERAVLAGGVKVPKFRGWGQSVRRTQC